MKRGLGPLLLILQLVLQVLHRLVAGEADVLAAGRGFRLGPGSAPRGGVIAECAQFDLCAAVGAGDEPADGCRRVLAELLGHLSSTVRTLDLRHRHSSHSRVGLHNIHKKTYYPLNAPVTAGLERLFGRSGTSPARRPGCSRAALSTSLLPRSTRSSPYWPSTERTSSTEVGATYSKLLG